MTTFALSRVVVCLVRFLPASVSSSLTVGVIFLSKPSLKALKIYVLPFR